MKPFDKYEYYLQSVQSPDEDVKFILSCAQELTQKEPQTLREDFAAAFALCCMWVTTGPKRQAIAVDYDDEPLEYGKTHYLTKLQPEEAQRITINKSDVLTSQLPSADVVCALNFSYFIFKSRQTLKNYFTSVYNSIEQNSLFIMDCFGGSNCYEAKEETTYYDDKKFTYYWDQENYNPITGEANFHIHFKRRGEKKRQRVFSYDWRLWTIPELKELLKEVGFSNTVVYWEESDEDGEGNGIFKPSLHGEECEAWIAYIAAVK